VLPTEKQYAIISTSTWDRTNHSSLQLQQGIRDQVRLQGGVKKLLKTKITELKCIIQGVFWNLS